MAEKKKVSKKCRIQSQDKGPKRESSEAGATGEAAITFPASKMPDDHSDLRRRAEEMLPRQPREMDKIPPADVQRMFHELRVHQIELEMQNEELRRTQQELEASREKYFDLYDLAPVGYVTLNEKGLILEANLAAAALLAKDRRDLVKQPLYRFIFREDQDIYYLHNKRLFETRRRQECEVRILKEDGTQLWARLEAVVVKGNNDEPTSRTMISDISRNKMAEEILEKLRHQNKLILNTVGEGIYGLDLEGNLTFVNPSAAKMLGYEVAELIGGHSHPMLHHSKSDGSIYPESECPIYAAFTDGAIHLVENEVFWRKDGSSFPVRYISTPMIEGDKIKGAVVSFSDITERKQAQEALGKAYDEMDLRVKERTEDLVEANQQLLWEIEERRKAEESLREALKEVRQLRDQLREENLYLREEINLIHSHKDIVGNSETIRTVLKQIEQVAPTDSTVLIQGETGTGKELLAHAIHNLSARKGRLMITVNCAALPPTLIESELFGREKGAFTGALSKQIGRFELADASTIFLDEIDSLPLELQAKLLRVLESGEFERLGRPQTVKVDVRIISATNSDLSRLVSKGGFREDLYYRLNVFQITVPPLRNRKEDIMPLVWSFVQEFSKRMGKRIESIPQKVVEALQSYPWPGNVRELRNVTERAMIITTGSVLHLDVPKIAQSGAEYPGTLEEVEKRQIIEVLNTTGWRVSGKDGAADILGINPKTLASRIQRLGIRRHKGNT